MRAIKSLLVIGESWSYLRDVSTVTPRLFFNYGDTMNSPELVAHILKQGGRVLVVGGETKDLPRQYHEHSQILIWDDNQQNTLNKEIPTNVRVIMWSRWVSHSQRWRLDKAARQLKALKFPNLKPREIKLLLSEVVQVELPQETIPEEVLDREIEVINNTIPAEPEPIVQEVKETTEMAKKQILGKGILKGFIAKHIDTTRDYTKKGAKTQEGTRLFDIAKKEGVKTTLASISNAVGYFVKDMEKGGIGRTSKPATTPAKTSHAGDDMAELERMVDDAITALKLVKEHLPKVRKETERLRGMKERFLKLLE